jgi:SAM-dependent methyltransferase
MLIPGCMQALIMLGIMLPGMVFPRPVDAPDTLGDGLTGSREVWNAAYAAPAPPLARCPYNFVASFLFRFSPPHRLPAEIDVLELGFGGGANLLFAARQGFRVAGVEVSDMAFDHAQRLFERESQAGDLRRSEFVPLPFADDSFDLVFDRAALSYIEMPTAASAIAEVRRVLRPAGRFLFNPYSTADTAAGDTPSASTGRTPFAHGHPVFYGRSDIERTVGSGFSFREMLHVQSIDECSIQRPCRSEWQVVLEAD